MPRSLSLFLFLFRGPLATEENRSDPEKGTRYERDRGTKRTAVSVTERMEKETPKDRSYVQSEACRCPSFVRRSARLSVPQSKPRRVGARTSEGYERTPVFLGSTCFVLRPCGTARLRLNRPNANFFFRRTGERDRNPYFLSATFLPGLRYNR